MEHRRRSRIFDWTHTGALRGHAGLCDQLERAVISVSNNIAEGYERGSTAELINFLYIARGSAGEVRSMLGFLLRAAEWSEHKVLIGSLRDQAFDVSRQLGSWIEAAKNSTFKGQRHQDDRTRLEAASRARRDRFLEELRSVQETPLQRSPPQSES